MDYIQELIAKFYETREESVYREAAAVLGREQTLWAAFCATSRSYYISPENGEHTAYVFTQEAYFKDFQDYMQKQGLLLDAVKNPPEHRAALLSDLQRSGFAAVLVNSGHNHLGIRLYDIIEKPGENAPLTNPVFLRAANYFYQSLHAGKPDRNAQISMFRTLYDAKLLMLVDPSELPEENGRRVMKPGARLGLAMALEDGGAKRFFPFFTDYHEVRRFDPEKKYRTILAGFRDLCNYSRTADGVVINPRGINLKLDTGLLRNVEQVVDGTIQKDAPRRESISIKLSDPASVPDAMKDAIITVCKEHKQVRAIYIRQMQKSETVRPGYLLILDAEKPLDAIYEAIAKAALQHAEGLDFEFTSIAEPFGKKATANTRPLWKRGGFGIFR